MIVLSTANRPSDATTAPERARGIPPLAVALFALILASLTGLGPGSVWAQSQRIAAVVNEDAISGYDLDARLDIVIATSNLPNRAEVRQRLAPQILRTLIDETLKLQESKRVGVAIDNNDIADGVQRLEQRNNMPPGGLSAAFKKAGLDWDSLTQQIRAEVAWVKAIQASMAGRINVSDEEITLYERQIQRNIGQPEYLVADIFLPVDSPSQDGEVQAAAFRMIEEMRKGANFAALAQQFSRGPSAQRGGDLGWIGPGDTDQEVLQALRAMTPGNLSQPVRTFGGYHILLLREQRVSTGGEAGPTVTLSRIVLAKRGSQAITGDRIQSLRSRIEATNSCESFNALAKEVGDPSGPMGNVDPNLLPTNGQQAIRDLPIGQPSKGIIQDGVEVYLMVCGRNTGGLPDKETLRARLIEQKIQGMAQRRLRDLRQQAIIDIRV
ncbi:MAG: peptidylprolyl isomerase [Rhodospirillum sp.]|nr:peptidylprolyl isomerase [Rhodospirillum sp.]MCF8488644.1 peptidylprolyl isomerase [Rhodospirillum sp.]MCF8503027.1 peptidylprolyl isomerase [Rhodospirillum sp.]